MTAVVVLGVLAGLLLLPLVVAAVRTPSLGALALRHLTRRRGEAVLVVAGSLLGTAIITGSFVVGDVVGASITDVARTQLGPIDVTIAAPDAATRDAARDAVQAADLDDVNGTLAATRATVALEARPGTDVTAVVPSAAVVELDAEAARGFGGDPTATGLDDLPADASADGRVVLNGRTAADLDVAAGDPVRLHAYGAQLDLTVGSVVDEVGLAGFGGALVAPGTFERLLAQTTQPGAPPEELLLVSLDGGVLETRDRSAPAVEALRALTAELPGVQVAGVKATLLDDAERTGDAFTELFTSIGAFSVLAGILLLVNLFVMLAEERKTELGMLRALGFTRRRLTRTFALEGALYAVLAAAVGTAAGVLVGWGVARAAGSVFGLSDQGITFRLVLEPTSLAIGGLLGLTISLATIWLTSLRIARLNVIRAIRDLPEPQLGTVRTRTLVAAGLGVLLGGALTTVGAVDGHPIPLLVGVPIAGFSAVPLLRRRLSERTARLVGATVVIGWGLGAFPLFPGVLGAADLPVFVVQGIVLTAGAVSLASSLDRVWASVALGLSARGGGLAARLGVAYPLARRFRTSMLLGMFSLVILTMTFIASMSAMFTGQAETITADASGGYDLLVDSNRANPVTTEDLLANDDVTAVAALSGTAALFEAGFTSEPRPWPMTGFDADLIAGGVPTLSSWDDAYPDPEAVYAAVLADPSLAIVSDFFLADGGPTGDRVHIGDTFHVLDPTTGASEGLTAVGITNADWVFNGVLVSRERTAALLGARDVPSRHYVAVDDGADAGALADELSVRLVSQGAAATTFAATVDEALTEQTSFLQLLQAFLGLGLLVGIAGLGVVMIRAVGERRQQIGVLRAMGVQARLVRSSLLAEAALIAVQGTLIGAVLGLVTARQALTSSDTFGDMGSTFVTPWLGLLVLAILPIAAALLATAWPATRAAATRPAVALRTAD